MKSVLSCIELLESRIAPAATFVNATTATYTDTDGDHVTVKFTQPILTKANVSAVLGMSGSQLQQVNVASGNGVHNGLGISITAQTVGGGDDHVSVGWIKATGFDLGKVTVDGDLDEVTAGDSNSSTLALKNLEVRSFGQHSTTIGATAVTVSVDGGIGLMNVVKDVIGADISASAGGTAANGTIGSIHIGGSLVGENTVNAGTIRATGDIGTISIGNNIQCGTAMDTGEIKAGGNIHSIHIGGSLIGGNTTRTGVIIAEQNLDNVFIGKNMAGGLGDMSGSIVMGGSGLASELGHVIIGGSLNGLSGSRSGAICTDASAKDVTIGNVSVKVGIIGGSNTYTGGIFNPLGDIGKIKVGFNLVGGSHADSGDISSTGNIGSVTIGNALIGGNANYSGRIVANGESSTIGSIRIHADLVGGNATDTGIIYCAGAIKSIAVGGDIASSGGTNSGSIRCGDNLGSLTVHGDITGTSAHPVDISVRGTPQPVISTVTAIKKISVGSNVTFTNIRAGYDTNLAASNAGASIGKVRVGGDWTASNLIAGVKNSGFPNFGDANDSPINPPNVTTIASIVIGGHVNGTASSLNSTDHFGFVAHEIKAFKVGGNTTVLQVGSDNDDIAVGGTFDTNIHEVFE
jgi:hypothetical protein